MKTKLSNSKNSVGRPSKFEPEFCEQAYKLCLLGLTNEELASFFGVATSSIDKWISEIPEFSGAIKKGRIIADSNVADRLYQRAMGYEHPEEKVFCNNGDIVSATVTKHYPPEPVAAFFWLKNRQRKKWKDKPDDIQGGESLKFRVGYGEKDG